MSAPEGKKNHLPQGKQDGPLNPTTKTGIMALEKGKALYMMKTSREGSTRHGQRESFRPPNVASFSARLTLPLTILSLTPSWHRRCR